jgi:hypothetical protein
METKNKRTGRIAAPLEASAPPESAAETPLQTQPPEEARETGTPAPSAPPNPLETAMVPPVSPTPPAIAASTEKLADFGSQAFAALEESRTAVARGFDALSEELARVARGGVDMAARTAIEMLAVKTVSDAIAVNAGFARASFDNWIGSSAKFSELGVKLATESSRPFLERLGTSWIGSRRTVH